MRCRKIYKKENQNNYNIMFFKSKGTKLPQNIKCTISKTGKKDSSDISEVKVLADLTLFPFEIVTPRNANDGNPLGIFVLTQDIEIVSGKTYYVLIDTTFVVVVNPVIEDIDTYYEFDLTYDTNFVDGQTYYLDATSQIVASPVGLDLMEKINSEKYDKSEDTVFDSKKTYCFTPETSIEISDDSYQIILSYQIKIDEKNSCIYEIEVQYLGELDITNKTYLISFYLEKDDNQLVIYQSEIDFKPITSQRYFFLIPDIVYKDFCLAIKDDTNYGEKQEGVAYSLIQRLSILKGELWYLINYGLPLLDKVRSGAIFDSVIINIILSHPDVKNIVQFSSSVENHDHYKFNAIISTIYNQDIEIGNSY